MKGCPEATQVCGDGTQTLGPRFSEMLQLKLLGSSTQSTVQRKAEGLQQADSCLWGLTTASR